MEEGANVMIMIGCDFHPGLEELALLDTETGRRRQHCLSHSFGSGPVREFYAGLGQPVRVGLEASGYSQWFEEMLEELGIELWVGDAARIRKAAPRKQKTDRNDARLLLQLLEENRFPRIWVPDQATRGKPYCYYHSRLKESAAQPRSPYLAIELPASLEDRGSIQLALSEIVTAIAESRIDPRRAGILLYALQIASSNAKHQYEIVCADSVDETVVTEQGEEMALEGAKAGPPEEESLATLLIKEVRRRAEENQQLSSDHGRQPDENKEFDGYGEGEGVSTPLQRCRVPHSSR